MFDVVLYRKIDDEQFSCKIKDSDGHFKLALFPENMLIDVLSLLDWELVGCSLLPYNPKSIKLKDQTKEKELKIEVYQPTPDSDWCFKALIYLNNKYMLCYTIPSSNVEDELERVNIEWDREAKDYGFTTSVLRLLGYDVVPLVE